MRSTCAAGLALMGYLVAAACGGSGGQGGGTAQATISGRVFNVNDVRITIETGEGGYFRIEGNDAAHPNDDCVPGLAGGLALYGDLPPIVTSLADLEGKELPFEFSGDGDDANLCFAGSNGLLGVHSGTVTFSAVNGREVTFAFTGSFTRYDGEGGESPEPLVAWGGGTAWAEPGR